MEYSIEEIQTHNTHKSLWVIIENNVYDMTSFLEEHPGGTKPLLKYAGTDVTAKFNSIKAHKEIKDLPTFLDTLKIGTVKRN